MQMRRTINSFHENLAIALQIQTHRQSNSHQTMEHSIIFHTRQPKHKVQYSLLLGWWPSLVGLNPHNAVPRRSTRLVHQALYGTCIWALNVFARWERVTTSDRKQPQVSTYVRRKANTSFALSLFFRLFLFFQTFLFFVFPSFILSIFPILTNKGILRRSRLGVFSTMYMDMDISNVVCYQVGGHRASFDLFLVGLNEGTSQLALILLEAAVLVCGPLM